MSDTLRDQLLGLGFKAPTPERKPVRKPGTAGNPASAKGDPVRHGQRRADGKPPAGKPSSGKPPARGDARGRGRGRPATREDIDLAVSNLQIERLVTTTPGEVRWTLFRGAATVEDAVVAATMGAPVGTGVRA